MMYRFSLLAPLLALASLLGSSAALASTEESSTTISAQSEELSALAPARKLFIDSSTGATMATSALTDGDQSLDIGGGASFDLALGYYLLPRLNVGGFYESRLTSDSFGVFGISGSSIYGIKADYALVQGPTFSWEIGARFGQGSFTSLNTVLFIPYESRRYKSWGAGPEMTFFWRTSQLLGLGAQFSYFQVSGGTADMAAVGTSDTTSSVRSFGVMDASLLLRFFVL